MCLSHKNIKYNPSKTIKKYDNISANKKERLSMPAFPILPYILNLATTIA